MKLRMQVGLGPGHIVWAQKGHSPQFSVHVSCGQTVGWIKTPLGMEVGLSVGDFVLDGDTAPQSTLLRLRLKMSIVAKRLDGSRYHLVQR